ncbi:putative triacylglycerol lipase [Blattamonas nauphoetae]|uniref:Triacylglycerol lipase n=1 Tax=Blattamonas nauphoetae TaxID=2049346 RepID=A0ABQ9X7U2_9EUKA|nr:putative triacylglycerol lipase [Blattamonas nauphoetae]
MFLSHSKTYPIILCHGVTRFDIVQATLFNSDKHIGWDGWAYFVNIRPLLIANGFNVEIASLYFCAGADKQAITLKRTVEETLKKYDTDKVHLIAHSFGGIVSRHMLWNYRHLNFHKHIASLTTFSTPHLGGASGMAVVKNTPIGLTYQLYCWWHNIKIPDYPKWKGPTRTQPQSLPLQPVQIAEIVSEGKKSSTQPLSAVTDGQSSISPLSKKRKTKSTTKSPSHKQQLSQAISKTDKPSPPTSTPQNTQKYPSNWNTINGIKYPPSKPNRNFYFLGIDVTGCVDCIHPHCEAFNSQVESFEASCGVRFRTIASTTGRRSIFSPFYSTLYQLEGPNDGMISVESAKWKPEYFIEPVLDFSHNEQHGMMMPFKRFVYGERSSMRTFRVHSHWMKLCLSLADVFPLSSEEEKRLEKQRTILKAKEKKEFNRQFLFIVLLVVVLIAVLVILILGPNRITLSSFAQDSFSTVVPNETHET